MHHWGVVGYSALGFIAIKSLIHIGFLYVSILLIMNKYWGNYKLSTIIQSQALLIIITEKPTDRVAKEFKPKFILSMLMIEIIFRFSKSII